MQLFLSGDAYAASPEDVQETQEDIIYFQNEVLACKEELEAPNSDKAASAEALQDSKDALKHHLSVRNQQIGESNNSSTSGVKRSLEDNLNESNNSSTSGVKRSREDK